MDNSKGFRIINIYDFIDTALISSFMIIQKTFAKAQGERQNRSDCGRCDSSRRKFYCCDVQF